MKCFFEDSDLSTRTSDMREFTNEGLSKRDNYGNIEGRLGLVVRQTLNPQKKRKIYVHVRK